MAIAIDIAVNTYTPSEKMEYRKPYTIMKQFIAFGQHEGRRMKSRPDH